MLPHPTANAKNCPAPNVSCAEVEKACSVGTGSPQWAFGVYYSLLVSEELAGTILSLLPRR